MELQEKMELLIMQQKESGLNKKAFCRQEGINYHRFDYWYRKSNNRNSGKKPGFVKVDTCRGDLPRPIQGLEIAFPNGVRINTGSSDLDLVAKLIRLY